MTFYDILFENAAINTKLGGKNSTKMSERHRVENKYSFNDSPL